MATRARGIEPFPSETVDVASKSVSWETSDPIGDLEIAARWLIKQGGLVYQIVCLPTRSGQGLPQLAGSYRWQGFGELSTRRVDVRFEVDWPRRAGDVQRVTYFTDVAEPYTVTDIKPPFVHNSCVTGEYASEAHGLRDIILNDQPDFLKRRTLTSEYG